MKNNRLKNFFNKAINKETILYIVFGILTTLVNFVVYILCNHALKNIDIENYKTLNFIFIGKSYLISNTIAWIIAVIFAFVTNKFFVFESKDTQIKLLVKEFFIFIGARIFSLLIEQLGLYILIDILLQKEFTSKIIISIIIVIINYFFSKLIVFNKK